MAASRFNHSFSASCFGDKRSASRKRECHCRQFNLLVTFLVVDSGRKTSEDRVVRFPIIPVTYFSDQKKPNQQVMKPIHSFSKVALCAAISILFAFGALAAEEKTFKKIFNGKDLSGWEGLPQFWSVQNGAITGKTDDDNVVDPNTFIVWQGGEVADFVLRLKFKIVGNNDDGWANSGIQYRAKVLDKATFSVGGYQADFEAGTKYSGILYEERGRGILALRGQKAEVHPIPEGKKKPEIKVTGSVGDSDEIQAAIKQGDWNDYRIVARGNRLMHFINGHKAVDVTDMDAAKAAKSGILALQLHKGKNMTVQFKNIRLRQ